MLQTVIFTGSFSPFCQHHLIISQALQECFDRVILVPKADSPTKDLLPLHYRREICRLAISQEPKIEIYTIEESTLTEKYWDSFTETFGDVYYVLGADCANEHWVPSTIHKYKYCIIPREGYLIPEWAYSHPHIILDIAAPGSSSMYRGTHDEALLVANTRAYIQQRDSYL